MRSRSPFWSWCASSCHRWQRRSSCQPPSSLQGPCQLVPCRRWLGSGSKRVSFCVGCAGNAIRAQSTFCAAFGAISTSVSDELGWWNWFEMVLMDGCGSRWMLQSCVRKGRKSLAKLRGQARFLKCGLSAASSHINATSCCERARATRFATRCAFLQ